MDPLADLPFWTPFRQNPRRIATFAGTTSHEANPPYEIMHDVYELAAFFPVFLDTAIDITVEIGKSGERACDPAELRRLR